MQTNVKKGKKLKEIDNRDDHPTDTFKSMVSEDPICDEDLGDFTKIFSEMTELN